MTTDELTFVITCEHEFLEYIYNKVFSRNRSVNISNQDKVRVVLAGALLQIIEDYFNYYDSSDDNFMEVADIQNVIYHFNEILESSVYINLE